jgi:hypothetical protein
MRAPTRHLGIGRRGNIFTSIVFEEPEKCVVKSLTTSTIDTAGYYLDDMCNVTPIPFSFKINTGSEK